jgi:hypothetical protein
MKFRKRLEALSSFIVRLVGVDTPVHLLKWGGGGGGVGGGGRDVSACPAGAPPPPTSAFPDNPEIQQSKSIRNNGQAV